MELRVCRRCNQYTDKFIEGSPYCLICSDHAKAVSIMKSREKRILISLTVPMMFLIFLSGCIGRPLTTNSPLIQDMKKNMDVNSENLIKLSKSMDKVSDKLGLNIPSLTLEFKDALKQQQADFDKKYDLLDAKLSAFIAKGAEVAGQAMGIPAPVTAGVIGLVSTYGGKVVSDIYANRRRERDAQQHAEELAEQEEEKEKIRLRLEREKEELRVKALIKQRTMAKVKPEYQLEYDRCKEEAERELKARGEI